MTDMQYDKLDHLLESGRISVDEYNRRYQAQYDKDHPYEIYAVGPNDDDQLLEEAATRKQAIHAWVRWQQELKGSAHHAEIWRDGEPVNEQ